MEHAKRVTDNYHQSLLNLTKAIQDAGGCVDLLDKDMTIQDLLLVCSTNSVVISAKHNRPEEKTNDQERLEEIVRRGNIEHHIGISRKYD